MNGGDDNEVEPKPKTKPKHKSNRMLLQMMKCWG